ncbi:hypothetical protein BZA77DRAFT_296731 [Pyronema omphalodes]|nr:hypothetical protein BZA77DRAFT_363211 [Pyronema omphalodes]KAI5812526.1 hypothetical protein BZA77DRAFT_296731 [Pyronema omphalodes]
MPRRVQLLDLPTELLYEIVSYLEPPEHSTLRKTCWTTRNVIAPHAFKDLTLNFQRRGVAQRHLQSLEYEGGITRAAVKEHIRTLSILEPRMYRGTTHLWGEPESEAAGGRNLLSVFQKLEGFQIIDVESHGRTYDAISQLLKYFESLQGLRWAHFILDHANIGISLRFPHLTRLVIQCDARMHQSLVSIFAGAPRLTHLALILGVSPSNDGSSVTLSTLFGHLDPSSPLELDCLNLEGWEIDDAAVQNIIPHLRKLHNLNLGEHVDGTELLWSALQAEGVKLEILFAPGHASQQLLQYLTSFSGLKEVSISTPDDDIYDDSDVFNVVDVIRAHAMTLQEVAILMKWGCEDHNSEEIADALEACTCVRKIALCLSGYDATTDYYLE